MKIGVLCGGWSREREISLRSGKNVYDALLKLNYDATCVDMHRDFEEQVQGFDLIFIMLHGNPGEDGRIQGYLDLKGIPYVGSGPTASAIGLDKLLFKRVMTAEGVSIAPYIHFDAEESPESIALRAMKNLGSFPHIIKPVREGSSIDTYIIRNEEDLRSKIQHLQKIYGDGLLEKFIRGREITIGVLGTGKDAFALPILELQPVISEFYDYRAKYTKGGTRFILPAPMPRNIYERLQDTAVKVHRIVGARDFSRVDMILREDGEHFVLEINTIPGMTDTSDLPAQAKEHGMSFEELVDFLVKSASRRYNL